VADCVRLRALRSRCDADGCAASESTEVVTYA
jgi:hypothetical protein